MKKIRMEFYPRKLADQRKWWLKYQTKLPDEGPLMGMTPTEITYEQGICDLVIAGIDKAIIAAAEAKQANKERNAAIQLNYGIIANLIKLHKTNTGYTEGIGEALGIIGSEREINWDTVKPILLASSNIAGVELKFDMLDCEAANIYSKQGKEESFTFFKTITHSHTIDKRPNLDDMPSEVRQYYAVLVVGDEEVGFASDIVTIKT